jgi:hypothetical protein
MARTREVAGGGRAVEVEPERLVGWFERFAARHGGLAGVGGTPDRLRFRAVDGATAEVAAGFGGLPPGAVAADPAAALAALHTHLATPRRIGIVLVRLGGYSVGVAVGGVVEASTTGARPVHGRTRKGGSSSGRFARRRDNQARVALDTAADAVARLLLPVAPTLDAVVLGGDAAALDELRADRRLAALLARAEPRVLDVPEPRRSVLDDAARRARAVEVVIREPAAPVSRVAWS